MVTYGSDEILLSKESGKKLLANAIAWVHLKSMRTKRSQVQKNAYYFIKQNTERCQVDLW